CPDVERDPRYVGGLEQAKSSLTVPLRLHDKVIGIFNIESRQRAAFNEDDRQFAEIFARYVAIALNILDLMIVGRGSTSHNGADAIAKIEVEEFDLVLSDIKMPDKTGYDVFASARKKGGILPVILMTGFGYDPNHSIVRASQEGLQAVLFKPFKVEQLLTEV